MCPLGHFWAPWEGSCCLHVPPATDPHPFGFFIHENSMDLCIIQGTAMNSSSLTALLGELCPSPHPSGILHPPELLEVSHPIFPLAWHCSLFQLGSRALTHGVWAGELSLVKLHFRSLISVYSLLQEGGAPAGLSHCPNFSRAL